MRVGRDFLERFLVETMTMMQQVLAMRSFTCSHNRIIAALCWTGCVRAQGMVDGFFFMDTGSLYHMEASMRLVGIMGLGSSVSHKVACAGDSIVFARDGFAAPDGDITQLDVQRRTALSLTSQLSGGGPHSLVVTHDRVWLLSNWGTQTGSIMSVQRDVPSQPYLLAGNIQQAAGLWPVIGDAATNGREIFFTNGVGMYAYDTTAPVFEIRPILPAGNPYNGLFDLTMALDGKCYVRARLPTGGDSVLLVDPETAAVEVAIPAAEFPLANQIGYDPWPDTFMSGGLWISMREMHGPTGPTPWRHMFWRPVYSLDDIAVASEPPFLLVGRGCANSTGTDPRLGYRGLPRQGGSFELNLRGAEAGGLAFFWFGANTSHWVAVGSLPYDAGPLGAPGCVLRVAPEITLCTVVDPSGRARFTQPMPIDPALAGLRLWAQTMSTTTANALGLAASDAVVIRTR